MHIIYRLEELRMISHALQTLVFNTCDWQVVGHSQILTQFNDQFQVASFHYFQPQPPKLSMASYFCEQFYVPHIWQLIKSTPLVTLIAGWRTYSQSNGCYHSKMERQNGQQHHTFSNVTLMLIIVCRGDMSNYSFLATFAMSLLKIFNMVKNLFLFEYIFFLLDFFGCFVEKFCQNKNLDATLEIRNYFGAKPKFL